MKKFVRKIGIESKIVYSNFKVIDFLESEDLGNLAQQIDCVSPQILTHCKLIDQTPGTVILSGNFLNGRVAHMNYSHYGLQRYTDRLRQNTVPFFFMYTPELAYSFFKIGSNIKLDNKPEYMIADYYIRYQTYLHANFKIYPQVNKKTGFEKIKELYDSKKIDPKLKLKYGTESSQRPFDYLFRYKLYERTGYYSNHSFFIYDEVINT